MLRVSDDGPLREGLIFESESVLMGNHHNVARIHVSRMLENEEIEMVNEAGAISYRAMYRIIANSPQECELICTIRFEIHNFVLDLARAAIESMARTRLQHDMERLRELIA